MMTNSLYTGCRRCSHEMSIDPQPTTLMAIYILKKEIKAFSGIPTLGPSLPSGTYALPVSLLPHYNTWLHTQMVGFRSASMACFYGTLNSHSFDFFSQCSTSARLKNSLDQRSFAVFVLAFSKLT